MTELANPFNQTVNQPPPADNQAAMPNPFQPLGGSPPPPSPTPTAPIPAPPAPAAPAPNGNMDIQGQNQGGAPNPFQPPQGAATQQEMPAIPRPAQPDSAAPNLFQPDSATPNPFQPPGDTGTVAPPSGSPRFTPPQQNGQENGQQERYKIIDMFWLVNKKLYNNTLGNETPLITIGYNASFNNLRFSFHNTQQDTFTQSSIIISNAPRLTVANIYAENAIELMTKRQTSGIERVFKPGNWTPNQTKIVWNEQGINIITQDGNGNQYSFTFVEEQVTCVEKALDFMINGQAWLTSLIIK